ncbi:tetratricopeptide repeat protein [Acidobacteriota bacterium]
MRRIKVIICLSAVFLLVMSIGIFLSADNQQSAKELYEAAVFKKDADGDMQAAIKLFQEIVERFSNNKEMAAKAQLQIGMCHEKLGQKSEQLALDAFRKVINNYPSQSEEVRIAKEKLAPFLKTQLREPKEVEELRLSQVRAPAAGSGGGAPSPDGRYISYVDLDTGDLAIYEIATGKEHRITNKGSWDESNEYAGMSRWSPDGKQIVYAWYNKNGFFDLRIIGIDGSKNRILFSDEEVIWTYVYDWSQDGEQILAYFDRKDGTNIIVEIVLVSTTDGSVSVLKTFDEDYPENLCFSPDGRFLVYDFPQKVGSPERDIFMLSTDGIREIPLVEHPSHDELLGWAPDGKNIIFASDRNGTFSLWNIKIVEGKSLGKPELVRSNMGSIEPLGFTQEGSFYFGYLQKSNNIYTVELNPKTGKILALPKKIESRFEGYNQSPIYSPDGKYLAYISRRFPLTIYPDYTIAKLGGNVLCIRSIETGKERDIFPNLRDKFFHPRWSPDGRSVFVKVWDTYDIYRIDTQTGNAALVLQDDKMDASPFELSLDGKTIFFVRRDRKNKTYQFIAQDLKSGDQKELYRSEGDLHIKLSPDGQWVIIQENYIHVSDIIPNLSIIPSTGGELRELWSFKDGIAIRSGAPSTWTPDGKYILFAMKSPKKEREKWDLYGISPEGGTPEKLGLEMSGFLMNLSIHPDGRNIVFSTSEKENTEVWVMENFLPQDILPQKKEKEDFSVKKVLSGAPSPDGKYLAYKDKETGDLAIREIATGKTRRLTNKGTMEITGEFVINSVISPDSKLVAYTWTNQYTTYDLCLIGIDGSGDRILYSGKYNQLELDSWSSDGKQIVFRKYNTKKQNLEIILVSVVDGTTQVLKTFEKPFVPRIRYSPDDRFIAYDFPSAAKSGSYDINLLAIDGSGEIHLIEHPANDRLLGWVPFREEMLFLSNRAGTYDIWAINVENGKEKSMPFPVKRDIGQISPKGFTTDGSFYYSIYTRRFTTEIAPSDLKTGKVQEELSSPLFVGSNFTVEWSPDGKNLVYKTEKTDPAGPGFYNRPLYVRNLKTGEERELAAEFEVNEPRWSPDGRSVLVIGHLKAKENQMAKNEGIYKIDVQNNQVTQIIQLPPDHQSIAEWSLDGKAVFYKNRDRILVRDLESGQEKQLYQNNNLAEFLDLSPDGEKLVLVAKNPDVETWSMLIMSVSGEEPRELCKLQGSDVLWNSDVIWTQDGNYVLFAQYDKKKGSTVWRISAEGGEPEMIWQSKDPNGFVVSLAVHPQDSKIAISFLIQEHEFWVMENFLPKTKDKK